MFSSAGRSTTSKYRILKEKDFILQKKLRFKKPERPSFKINTLPIEEINEMAEKEFLKLKKVIST